MTRVAQLHTTRHRPVLHSGDAIILVHSAISNTHI